MDLHVSRELIFDLLRKNKFVIPAYQREYAWDEEQCSILWEDLTQFYEENKGKEREYFLGTIVCYKEGEKKELHVIDGQQRITTFLLLLKAMYRKLEKMYRKLKKMAQDSSAEQEKIRGLQRQIEPCIWHVDSMTQKPDFVNTRIETKVYTKLQYNDHLQKVFSDDDLKNDDCNFDNQYNYVQNYKLLIKKIDELSVVDLGISGSLFEFIVCLRNSCVLLPITCADFEMGLKIFQTLNDRGMPLSDADIFKQQLYKNYKTDEERQKFNKKWTDINDLCNAEKNKIEIVDIFKYYMHVIRASQNKTDNVKGLRNFYLKENKNYLSEKKANLITDITNQAMTWSAIHNEFPEDLHSERFKGINEESKKYLQILMRYPNELREFTVSVLLHRSNMEKLSNPLKKITAALYFQFLKTHSVVYIRPKVYAINNNIHHDKEVLHNVFKPEEITQEAIQRVVKNVIEERTAGKLVKGLLTLYLYLDKRQDHIPHIGEDYCIEHILPRKWQDTNYKGWSKEDANQYIESIGNKVLFEHRLNIQAGNGYFNNKKEKHKESRIHKLRSLAENQDKQDWVPEDIQAREKDIAEVLTAFFYEEFHP